MSSEESKLNYENYKNHGICPQCGVRKAAPNRVRCEECLAKNAESRAKGYSAKTDEEKAKIKSRHRSYLKSMRADRKSKGLCIYCGKKQYSHSTAMCIDCFIKNQRKNEKRKIGIDRSKRPLYGLCYTCGAEISSGKLCNKCLERSIKNLPEKMNDALYAMFKNENRAVFRN